MDLTWCRTHSAARVPKKGTTDSAGYDLFATEDVLLNKGLNIVNTHVKIQMQPRMYGQIFSRSGLAFSHSISVLGGVIDSDYLGEIKVMLFNPNEEQVLITHGKAIAQIVFLPCINDIEFHEVDQFVPTERGDRGFGSTDKK